MQDSIIIISEKVVMLGTFLNTQITIILCATCICTFVTAQSQLTGGAVG